MSRPDGDAGEGDVAHPVADQREPALDEEDADERGDEADEDGREQGPLHEVVREQLGHDALPVGPGLGGAGQRRPRVEQLVVVVVGVVLVQDLGLSGEEHVARPVEDDAAAVDDDDAGHDLDERVHLVGHDEHRHALGGQPAEHLGEDVLVGGVHPRGRLVHEQHVGLGGERAGDEHPALLPAREGADIGPGAVGEADDVERAGDDLPVGRRRPSEPRLPHQPSGGDDLLGGRAHRPREGVPLRDVPEPGVVTAANRSSGVPNSRTSPPSWSLSPSRPLTIVDLPAPFGPRIATTSPG